MYVETYVLSLAAWLLIVRTSLGMSRFLRWLATSWFALFVAMHIFTYTQNHDWKNLVQAGLWTLIAVNTVLAKPIDKRGFWRDLREMAFPMFDVLVLVLVFAWGLPALWHRATVLQMTSPAVDKVLTTHACPPDGWTKTLWSGKVYVTCDTHKWEKVTSVYVSVQPGPNKDDVIAAATVGFDNVTGKMSFLNRE